MARNTPEAAEPLVPPALLRALRHMLRPLVRLLLANHLTYPMLANLLKGVYVETASRDFAEPGVEPTLSRLSVLTGVHRKDVKRLRDESDEAYRPPASVSLGARLVALWQADTRFSDESGAPLPLPRAADAARAGAGAASTALAFEALVRAISTDIRPRAVLDEFLRLGLVEIDSRDRVVLVVDAFAPRPDFDDKIHYFGRLVHDHIAAAEQNIAGAGEPLLDRAVYYDGLCNASVQELSRLSEALATDAIRAVNRRALQLQQQDAASADADQRMTFGSYFYRTQAERDDA